MGISRRDILKAGISIGTLSAISPATSHATPQTKHIPVDVHYNNLSDPIAELKEFYDVIVIGSGYGGAVMASRLASGRRLAILERGPERPPGSFVENLQGFLKDLRSLRNPHGLFELHMNRDMDVLTGNGLGGTSLINAGAVVEPDHDIFREEVWPKEIVDDVRCGEFQKYFSRVKAILQTRTFDPERLQSAKVEVHRLATEKLQQKFEYAPIAVNLYGQKQIHGVEQPRCIQCGNCCAGCNTGAKNTLNMNYLPLAKSQGAEIYTRMEVDHIEKIEENHYRIHCDYYFEGKRKERKILRSRTVIISAGTMGSTKILLRSREQGLKISSQVGQRFSGNGDVLGLSFNTAYRTNSIGFESASEVRVNMRPGAVIYGIADYRKGREISDRFIIEEGTFPGALTIPMRMAMGASKCKLSPTRAMRVWRDVTLSSDIEKGALNYSMVYLGMGHDRANGKLVLDHRNRVRVHWPEVVHDPVYPMIDREMRRQSAVVGGNFIMNPRTLLVCAKNLITVHPMGGCVMADSVENGVVNHLGQVFNANGDLHEGLIVMDGSVIPSALGVNPLLTISALAERAAAFIASKVDQIQN